MMSVPGRGSALLRSKLFSRPLNRTPNCSKLTSTRCPGSRRVCTQCARPAPRPRTTTATPPLARPYPSPVALPLTARRYYAAEATASTPPPPTPTKPTTTDPSTQPAPDARYRLKAGLILTRPPLLTREQTPFESAYYLYQKRLNERLTAPFRRAFYFKPDSAADLDFRIKLKERHGVPAKDIGRYNPRSRTAWNDELLVGSPTSAAGEVVDKLLADAEVRVSEDGEPIIAEERVPVDRPRPRRTEADEKGDVRRLDRALDRTLYLVVRSGEGEAATWGFPTGVVPTEEMLHEVWLCSFRGLTFFTLTD